MNTEIFPVYDILVNNVFGSIGLAVMGVAFAMLIILLLSRSSTILTINWLMFYFVVMGTMYYGATALVLGMIFVGLFIAVTIIRQVSGEAG